MIALNINRGDGTTVRCYLGKSVVYWQAIDLLNGLCGYPKEMSGLPIRLPQLRDVMPGDNRRTLLLTRREIDLLVESGDKFWNMKPFIEDVEERGVSIPELFTTVFKRDKTIYLDATLGGYSLKSINSLVGLPLRNSLRTLLSVDNFKNFLPVFLTLAKHFDVPHETLLDQIRQIVNCDPILDAIKNLDPEKIDLLSKHLTLHTIEYCSSTLGIPKTRKKFLESIIRLDIVNDVMKKMNRIQSMHFPRLGSNHTWTVNRWTNDNLEDLYLDMCEILIDEIMLRVNPDVFNMEGKIIDDPFIGTPDVLRTVVPEYFSTT